MVNQDNKELSLKNKTITHLVFLGIPKLITHNECHF